MGYSQTKIQILIMFLTNLDYTSHQSSIDLLILTNSNNLTIRNKVENAAVEQIKTHLRKRYDVNEMFIDVRIWSGIVTYSIGDHVEHEGSIYYASQASTNEDPSAVDSEYWTLGDLRDPYLILIVLNITVYHLHTKVSKRLTPQDVADNYADALDWLKGVSKGEFVPNFPELIPDADTQTNHFQFGSQAKLNHRY